MSDTVQHLRWVEGATDGWGDASSSWAEPVELVAVVAPRLTGAGSGSRESDPAGYANRVISDLTLFTPPGLEVGPKDRFVVRGRTYEVEGEAFDWRSPFTDWRPGGQVALRAVSG